MRRRQRKNHGNKDRSNKKRGNNHKPLGMPQSLKKAPAPLVPTLKETKLRKNR